MLKKLIKNKFLLNVAECGIALLIAAAAFFIIYNYVGRTGLVNGVSMEPTLAHGDMVVINKLAYIFSKPDIGDIIAFPYPVDPGKELIKRVIGVEGDVIDYVDYVIYVNGQTLPEEYDMDPGGGYSVRFPLTVPEGTVFVLGDNRWASEDSRYAEVGCVNVSDITGKVFFRLMPFSKIGLLK